MKPRFLLHPMTWGIQYYNSINAMQMYRLTFEHCDVADAVRIYAYPTYPNNRN